MDPERRFTLTADTPASLPTAFSTWAEQAEQVMPVTVKVCFIVISSFLWNERSLHQLLQSGHQLVDDLVVPLPDAVGHAGADVLGEELLAEAVEAAPTADTCTRISTQ